MFTFVFRLTELVADLDDTTPAEPGHPSLVLIIEHGDDLARIVIPASLWPPEKRELLAVDRPVALTGESDFICSSLAPERWRLRYGCSITTTDRLRTAYGALGTEYAVQAL